VGYAGGTTANPTYYDIGNHSETVQVEFDPTVVSYEQLLTAFWNSHDASYPSNSTQYRSAIFYTSAQQQQLANEIKQANETSGEKLYTDIIPFTAFNVAEDYHQKYYLRDREELVDPLYDIYPIPADFRDSTAAARLNGYLGGYGDVDSVRQNLDKLGLTETGKRLLLQIIESGLSPVCPVIAPIK
jgi:peptide-methionine (S)-S-oxide reductase